MIDLPIMSLIIVQVLKVREAVEWPESRLELQAGATHAFEGHK